MLSLVTVGPLRLLKKTQINTKQAMINDLNFNKTQIIHEYLNNTFFFI